MYKTFFFTCLTLLLMMANFAEGQQTKAQELDSLKNVFASSSNDSIKVELLGLMFNLVLEEDPNKVEAHLKWTDRHLKEPANSCPHLTQVNNWSLYHARKGDFSKAEKGYLKVIAEHEVTGCPKGLLFSALLNIGDLYRKMGDMVKAVEYTSKCSFEALASDNEIFLLTALNNLGIIYFGLKDFAQAKNYYGQALVVAKRTGSPNRVSSIQLNLGNILFMEGNYADALAAYEEPLAEAENKKDSIHLPSRYINVGLAHYGLGQLDRAMKNMKRGLQCAKAIGSKEREALALRNMSNVASAKQEYAAAIAYINQSLVLYQEMGASGPILRAYPNLATYYSKNGQNLQAYETQKKYGELMDSVSKSQTASQLSAQLAEFEADRLKAENDSIQRTLTISQQAAVINDLKLSRYNYLIVGLIGMLVLMGVLIAVIVRANRLRLNLQYAELKHAALRARMNPHFLFNALNAIQNAILNRDKIVAYEYHAKFSDLMRMILMHSDQKTVKLQEEIEALRLYLDLEQFRTGNGFDYAISLAKDVNPETQEIPSMLLQPFVENAIWHGVLNRDSPGTIDIRIAQNEGFLQCAIEDDGVGREAASRIRNLRNPEHSSVALQVTEDRISLFQKQYGGQIGLHFKDKKVGDQATGTLVELSIPLTFSA